MFPEGTALLALAESIADGATIDWEATEKAAAGASERAVIRELRILSALASLHRSMPAAGTAPMLARTQRSGEAPAIGSWAHLTLVARLGGGASGEVYRAWDRDLEREVALKLLRGDASDEDLEVSQIAREGRLLARVRHPNVITVHGVAVHERRVGLWMELVSGVTLEQQLSRGTLSAREAALVGLDLCRALAAIHAAGLIHRDVKAQNVMREDGGRIVLMDLGTGRERHPVDRGGVPDLAGTPLYLAPEIFRGEPASEKTDLYSLGVLLYHLVTGSYPVRAATVQALHEQHKQGLAVRLRDARANLPTAFVRAVDRAIGHNPDDRYATAGAFEAALVETLADGTPDASKKPPGESTNTHTRPWRRFLTERPALAAAVLLAVVAAGTLGSSAYRWISARRAATAAVPGRVSLLAVLPFENLSEGSGAAYLADAVPMEMSVRLGHVAALKVVPWTFTKQFGSGSRTSLKEVSSRTGADAIVQGSVQMVPGESDTQPVHVRVQVYEASTGGLLWSSSFERSLGDFFALQAQVAQELTSRLHVVLAEREQALVSQSRRVPPQAMEAYLNGRQLQRVDNDNRAAADSFTRAIRLAPRFAEAYTGLSLSYALQSAYDLAVPPSVALPRALEASNRAIALDAGVPEAWAIRAFARFVLEGNWAAADSDFKRALQLGPESVDVLEQYSNFLTDRGRHAEAIAAGRKAEERAPFSAATSRQVAWAYYMAGQHDDAIRQARQILANEPKYVSARTVLGRSLLFRGQFDEGLRELDSVGPQFRWMVAVGYAMAGRRAEAERLASELASPATDRPSSAYHIALIYVALRDEARALEWFATAVKNGDPSLTGLGVDPMLDPIRSNRDFQALLAQVDRKR